MRSYLAFYFILNSFTIIYSQVGNSCTLPFTGGKGTCKLVNDCPAAVQLANNGIPPEICGHQRKQPIVCCANDIDEPPFIFPDTDGSGMAQKKCQEYRKPVRYSVSALPLVSNPEAVSVTVEKCDYEKIPLIVNGEAASLGEFPHMAAIGFNTGEGIKYNCGGTLISEEYVLTAAHCTYSIEHGRPVRIRLGDLDINKDDDGAKPQEFAVADIIRHPDLKPRIKYNDIALIRLSGRVKFNREIRPACLYTEQALSSKKAVATGWGLTSYGGDSSDLLLKVSLDLLDNAECEQYYRNTASLPRGIIASMLCAGDLLGRKDTCQGDSGGPLVITDKGNQCVFYLIGITSFGKGCANPNSPAVYTRVSEYIPWIEKIVWG